MTKDKVEKLMESYDTLVELGEYFTMVVKK